jgi:hypothetical protein
MDIRVECTCGQAYEFAVEPANNLMPCPVACPACGTDGTQLANQFIASSLGIAPIPVPPPVSAPTGLRINRPQPQATPPPIGIASQMPAAAAPPPPLARAGVAAASRSRSVGGENNLGMGILGAILGAALGAGLMYGFFLLADFKFPLFGVGIGALTGYGARLLYRGTDHSLGVIAAVISLGTVAGTLYLMFGDLAIINIVSMIVSVSVAYRIAS